jgi:hypothetical protein
MVHTIASNHQELVVLCNLVCGDVGVCGDYLLFGGQLGALFEFKIANSPGEGEVAVNTPKINKAAGSTYTRLLA